MLCLTFIIRGDHWAFIHERGGEKGELVEKVGAITNLTNKGVRLKITPVGEGWKGDRGKNWGEP